MCQHGSVPGPSAGAGGLLQVHHSGTQRDLSDTQTAPKHHGGASEAAQHQERHHGAVREPGQPHSRENLLTRAGRCGLKQPYQQVSVHHREPKPSQKGARTPTVCPGEEQMIHPDLQTSRVHYSGDSLRTGARTSL